MSNEKELLLGLTTKIFNKSQDEIAPLIYEGDEIKETAFENLINLDAGRIKKYKDGQTEQFNNGYKKAQKETAAEIEAKWKEVLALDSDKIGDDLIEEARLKIGQKASTKAMTDEDVKKHPAYLNLEKQAKKEWEAKLQAKEQEFEQYKNNITKSERGNKGKNKVLNIFNSLNPILSKDAIKAENQKQMFVKIFDNFDFQFEEDGTAILLDDSGKRLEDKNGYPITLENFVKEKAAQLYDFAAQTPKDGTGNENKPKQQGNQPNGQVNMNPKSAEEYAQSFQILDRMNTEESNKKLVELVNNWKASQPTK